MVLTGEEITPPVVTGVSTSVGQRSAPRVRNWYDSYKVALGASDALAITAALVAAYVWRFGEKPFVHVGGSPLTYALVSVFIAVSWWLLLSGRDSRERGIVGSGLEEYRRVLSASLTTFGGLAIGSYFLSAEISRWFFLTLLVLGTCLLLLGRWTGRHILHRRRARGGGFTPTIVVGGGLAVGDVVRDLRRNPNAGFRPVAVVVGEPQVTGVTLASPELGNLPVVDLASLGPLIAEHHVRAVVVAPGLPRETVRQLAWKLENSSVRLMFVPSLVDVAGPRMSVHQMQDLSLLSVDLPRFSGWNHALKRTFDLVFSSVALIVLSPVMAVVALLIKREDGGPIMFRQERIGARGKPFVIHKFRTMCIDAESRIDAMIAANGGSALLFKAENDPRITQIGKVLRKYSLDELPQFWTVLRGSMSIVGPRPQVSREVAEYTDETHRRLLIKPGITGLWQVNGRSRLSVEDSIRYDLRYVENWSLTGDLTIIMRTIRVVLNSSGAF